MRPSRLHTIHSRLSKAAATVLDYLRVRWSTSGDDNRPAIPTKTPWEKPRFSGTQIETLASHAVGRGKIFKTFQRVGAVLRKPHRYTNDIRCPKLAESRPLENLPRHSPEMPPEPSMAARKYAFGTTSRAVSSILGKVFNGHSPSRQEHLGKICSPTVPGVACRLETTARAHGRTSARLGAGLQRAFPVSNPCRRRVPRGQFAATHL